MQSEVRQVEYSCFENNKHTYYLIGLIKSNDIFVGALGMDLNTFNRVNLTVEQFEDCFNVATVITTPDEYERANNTGLYISSDTDLAFPFPVFYLTDGHIQSLPIYDENLNILEHNSLVIIGENEGKYYVVDSQDNKFIVDKNDIDTWRRKYSFYNYNSLICKQNIFKLFPSFTEEDARIAKVRDKISSLFTRGAVLSIASDELVEVIQGIIYPVLAAMPDCPMDITAPADFSRATVLGKNSINYFFTAHSPETERFHFSVIAPELSKYRSLVMEHVFLDCKKDIPRRAIDCRHLRIEYIDGKEIASSTLFLAPPYSFNAVHYNLMWGVKGEYHDYSNYSFMHFLYKDLPDKIFYHGVYFDTDKVRLLLQEILIGRTDIKASWKLELNEKNEPIF